MWLKVGETAGNVDAACCTQQCDGSYVGTAQQTRGRGSVVPTAGVWEETVEGVREVAGRRLVLESVAQDILCVCVCWGLWGWCSDVRG